jgi:hypothetical protein
LPEYQGGRPPTTCKFPTPVYFLPGLKDDRGESQAGQLAGVPGWRATQGDGVKVKLPEPVYFPPGLNDDRGRARLASLPEYQGGGPPKETESS